MKVRGSEGTCARCGRPVGSDDILCVSCRDEAPAGVPTRDPRPSELEERASRWPATMARPSRVQYHATVMVAIALALLGLGLFAFLSSRGVGPFTGDAASFRYTSENELVVTGTVANEGTRQARANCRVVAVTAADLRIAAGTFLSELIEPGGEVEFTARVRDVTVEPADVQVFCT